MAKLGLYDYQLEAVENMHNGCILCGGVGSGKSRTALGYYYKTCGGDLYSLPFKSLKKPIKLFIITTAKKRDSKDWIFEMTPFRISAKDVVIDSWNNIKKYIDVKDSFFIFDEQRVVGHGAWVKSFIKIARRNLWILLSATPGDTWMDYRPVFIANGFYKNFTDFNQQHVIFKKITNYLVVDRYVNTGRLIRCRNRILVSMDYKHDIDILHETVSVKYNREMYKSVMKNRWDPFEQRPIDNSSHLCMTLRKICGTDESRIQAVIRLVRERKRVIVFYNYNYELDILMQADYGDGVEIAQWNGQKHQPIPTGKNWVYLVQYTAGAEGWNCITTDTIVFYSENYSYKIMEQSAGRINRLNTPFGTLYYYHLRSGSGIDNAVHSAIVKKKKFSESAFTKSI